MLSSRATSASGDGRKSLITFIRPISPALYLTVLLLIDCPSFAPIAGAENADHATAPGEPHCHHAAVHDPEAEIALLRAAVVQTSAMTRRGSKNACCARSNGTPCLRRLMRSLTGSQAKLGASAIVWRNYHII